MEIPSAPFTGKILPWLTEVQTGSYFGGDNTIRIENEYRLTLGATGRSLKRGRQKRFDPRR
jgi:hypothetical protein